MIIYKRQRIRDPVHDLIEFGTDPFDRMLWHVIDTPQFQRLRRIRQTGFSEIVFPGATHTRFAHSLGVLHTARLLMRVIGARLGKERYELRRAETALAAALVHDVGHGMFSHAFEPVGEELGLPLAKHAEVSKRLILDSEVTVALNALTMASRKKWLIWSARSSPTTSTMRSCQANSTRTDSTTCSEIDS